MAGCITRCTTYRTDSIANAWLDIRDHFGPRVSTNSDVYIQDITEWTEWATQNSVDPVLNVSKFGNWLIWKCSYGTTNFGNLPTRNRDHIGISCIPCPYDSNNYDAVRSELWLGFTPTTLVDHGIYFMKVSQRGSAWGFSCTYPGCIFQTENGHPYFHV